MLLITSIVLFVLSVLANANPCPPPEDIEPCYCNPYQLPVNITCTNVTNTEQLFAVFTKSGEFPFEDFHILNSQLLYLPASSVMKKKIERLTIVDTIMTSIFESQPDPANSLHMMTLHNVRLQRGIQWEFFRSFTQLGFLNISDVDIKKMGKDFKDNVGSSLFYLRTDNAKTTTLEDGVFARLDKLASVEVTNSRITTLKRNMFANPSGLIGFDFSGNKIESLPDDMFTNMPYLERILLDRNQLTVLPAAVYNDFYKKPRSHMSFLDNPVVCDCPMSWIFPRPHWGKKLSGICAAPPSKKGVDFDNLTERDFRHC